MLQRLWGLGIESVGSSLTERQYWPLPVRLLPSAPSPSSKELWEILVLVLMLILVLILELVLILILILILELELMLILILKLVFLPPSLDRSRLPAVGIVGLGVEFDSVLPPLCPAALPDGLSRWAWGEGREKGLRVKGVGWTDYAWTASLLQPGSLF